MITVIERKYPWYSDSDEKKSTRITLNQAEDWLRQKIKEGRPVELVEK